MFSREYERRLRDDGLDAEEIEARLDKFEDEACDRERDEELMEEFS